MTADEIMLSESQERMLMIIKPNELILLNKYLKVGPFIFFYWRNYKRNKY